MSRIIYKFRLPAAVTAAVHVIHGSSGQLDPAGVCGCHGGWLLVCSGAELYGYTEKLVSLEI